MDKYDVCRKIGVGSYGSVFQVKVKPTKVNLLKNNNSQDSTFCLKKIRLDNVSAKERAAAHQEVKLLASLNHPFVLKYCESFQYHQFLCIVTEFCEAGDLYNWLKKQRTYVKEEVIIDMFSQIVLAVKYVHDKKVLHRDLKTQNVFLHRDGTIKLGDFGIARVLRFPSEMARTVIGTPYYMSPEIMESRPYEFKSDLWALGCVLYEMASLKHAFDAQDMNGLVVKILRGKALPTPNHYSAELKALITKLLLKNPKNRAQIDDILQCSALEASINKHRALCDEARRQRLAAQAAANANENNSAASNHNNNGPSAAHPSANHNHNRHHHPNNNVNVKVVAGAADRERLRDQARARLQREIRREESERQLVEANMKKVADRRERNAPNNPYGGIGAPIAGRRAKRGPAGVVAADAAAANLVAPSSHQHQHQDPVSLEAELAKAELRLREIQRQRHMVQERRHVLQREWQVERESRVDVADRQHRAEVERHAAEKAAAAAQLQLQQQQQQQHMAGGGPVERKRRMSSEAHVHVMSALDELAREEAALEQLPPKDRMRRRKELENRRRELQLLEARKRYFEERKVADYKAKLERGIVSREMSEPSPPRETAAPTHSQAAQALLAPPVAQHRRSPPAPMAEDSDDDEEAADLQRYQERHKLLTMRIDELKEESKRLDEGGAPERAVAAMDKQDRARDLATGLSSSDDSGDDRTPRLGGARVVKDGAAASGAAESDGGVALPAKALEGGLSARADALRQALERGIGASLLDKLTREVQKHHAMKGDGVAHDAEEELFWVWVRKNLGKPGESYAPLLDQYAYCIEQVGDV
ncbi:hypothetical protein PPROV_000218700 [Pycnococcus provasolii]|uniref:non-specific serine/threonine protein kinase n=1 Tax=Pycnococcus provasolii TaxID=41880 RepID=A0A830H9X7_9CHLO|nr:hypothetical protein PPROV_000218700 [Pycnococcus provasolii]